MELNINSPAYYKSQYGVIDDIYFMCREISAYVRERIYSDFVNIIGITPIVAPESVLERGLWREEIRCEIKYGFASVSLHIDYEKFVNGSIEEKKRLIAENILASVKVIQRRAKIDFDEFYRDIMCYCRQTGMIL